VAETVPDGWNLTIATGDDGSLVSRIALSPGEHVMCTFVDVRERGAIDISKTAEHAADGSGEHPQAA